MKAGEAFVIVLSIILSFFLGIVTCIGHYTDKGIALGVAHYDSKTGDLVWDKPKK